MKTENVLNKTGKHLNEWYELISEFGGKNMTHKSIADELQKSYSVDTWWAQTICVEYEKKIGRRILGQTEDGKFQLGISRTFPVNPQKLWDILIKESSLWTDVHGPGIKTRFSTYVEGSHFRMPWTADQWGNHSILQVRVLKSSSPDKSVCSIHQEKIPTQVDRSALKEHWKQVLDRISKS